MQPIHLPMWRYGVAVMTTQDRYIDYGTLPTGIPRVLHQFMLGINTAMPGEVVRYDAATRRADVRGQLWPCAE